MRRRDLLGLLGGAAVTWPLGARAQKPAMPVIGYLHSGSPGPFASEASAFRQGLKETGHVEGQNVAIEFSRRGKEISHAIPGLTHESR
jgi:putative tryptophan/tyrosine transport system substrate-binding protein